MIGLFDSGVGGLPVWRELRRLLPGQDTLYVADQAHLPYGPRSLDEVRAYSVEITRFLVERGARIVVVACNSASAAALHPLRALFPATRIVGMEPAVKPAARETRTGCVGVLATPATFQGDLFADVLERHGAGVRVIRQICPGLVELVERGEMDGPGTVDLVRAYVAPLVAAGADSIVLGCTHYTFLTPVIQGIAGPGVRIIDPAAAVAAQTRRVAAELGLSGNGGPGGTRFWSSGDPAVLGRVLARLGEARGQIVWPVSWVGDPPRLVEPSPAGVSHGDEGGAG